MNINKILTHVTFDDFLTFVDNCTTKVLNNKQAYIKLTRNNKSFTREQLNNRLFITFADALYKREHYNSPGTLMGQNNLMYILFSTEIFTEHCVEKYKHLFIHFTSELNSYLLANLSNDDKTFLFINKSKLLQDFYKFNDKLLATNKSFCLDYIIYVKDLNAEHLQLILTIYPELLKIKDITDESFLLNFWQHIFTFKPLALTSAFVNKYYTVFLSDTFKKNKNIIFNFIRTVVFFTLPSNIQKKFKNIFNN